MRPVYLTWRGAAGEHRALWLSPSSPPPSRAAAADDRTAAGPALARARKGEGLVYEGDFRNARQLLAAMGRRLAGRSQGGGTDIASRWVAERRLRRAEHEVLSRLIVPIGGGCDVPLPNAPEVRQALEQALGPATGEPGALPLRELLGMIGAHEWRRRGVHVEALGGVVRPHYGVFAPVRGEHVDLVARAARERPLAGKRALDAGTGTGVLALLLARAGARVIATDAEPRAIACAQENARAHGLADRVEVMVADLFPPGDGTFDLVVSNPPWLPGEAHSPLERAVYDPAGAFLRRLVAGLPARLAPSGEAWIVLSDLAEHLGLRREGELEALAAAAGLRAERLLETSPVHPRARDREDPLFDVRSRERTRLWRLARP